MHNTRNVSIHIYVLLYFSILEVVIYCNKIRQNTKEWANPGMYIIHKVSIDNIMKDWFLFPVYDSPILRHIILLSVCFYVWTMWWIFVLEIRTLKLLAPSIRRLYKQPKNPYTPSKIRFLRRVLIFEGTL